MNLSEAYRNAAKQDKWACCPQCLEAWVDDFPMDGSIRCPNHCGCCLRRGYSHPKEANCEVALGPVAWPNVATQLDTRRGIEHANVINVHRKKYGEPSSDIDMNGFIIEYDDEGSMKSVHCNKNGIYWSVDEGWSFVY